MATSILQEAPMSESNRSDDSPKFGRLLAVLVAVVLFCVALTWVMATYFPNFPA
ncbi:hypothetical protein ACLB1G_14150 [Oxalobacteraceae bacterium A2-2]